LPFNNNPNKQHSVAINLGNFNDEKSCNQCNAQNKKSIIHQQKERVIGLYLLGSETNVDVLKCAVKKCGGTAMFVHEGATVTATQCEFMENDGIGVCCWTKN
jgi:hypothetical protein